MARTPSPADRERSEASDTDRKHGLSVKLIVALVLLAVALVFVFSNLGTGKIFFLGFGIAMPTWIWFLLVLLIGVVIGSLFPWFRPRRKGK
ncbi:MAG: LapA family protein [Microbacteriaceae bacterium]|nr:MAG: LapA family protein [Microbacteriaceae bacterium]